MFARYLGTKSISPTPCDSATLFDPIRIRAALCRAQRSEAAPTWLPSFWSRTRRWPAPYPTAAPLAAPPANHGVRNPCVCFPPAACQPTPAGWPWAMGLLFHVFACLPLGLLSAVQPGLLGRIFAAYDWAPHKPAPPLFSAVNLLSCPYLLAFTCDQIYLLFVFV